MPIPILAKIGSWIGGGIIESAGKVAVDVGKTYFGDKTEKEQHLSAEQLAVLNQYAAEFAVRTQRTWWDSFVDGLNRIIRPALAIGAQLAFVWVFFDPVGFAECMQALQLVPEMLWYVWIGIISFFFGGRIIENAPKAWKIEPRALDVAKSIAEERASRRKTEAAQFEADAAERIAAAARKEALAETVSARAAERQADAEVRKTDAVTQQAEIVPEVKTPDDIAGSKRISERGLDLIRRFEGLEEKAYVCPGGALTIGYGHVIKPGEPYGQSGYFITPDVANDLLDRDCDIAENAVNELVSVPISQSQFDALVSFVYNVGVSAFAKSTLLAKINAGDAAGAAAEFERWNQAKGKVLSGLNKRREAERRLFEASD